MTTPLLTIRIKQILRGLIDIGLIRLIFILGVIGYLCFVLYKITSDGPISQYISIAFLMLLVVIHLRRRDKLFLRCHFSNYKSIMLFEYMALSIPVLLCLLINEQWIATIELLLGLTIVVQLDFKAKRKNLNTKLQDLIPSECFEWKAGLRKQFFIIVPVWIMAVLTSFFIGSVPVAILILSISVLNFFENNEPYQVLLSYELSPRKLLLHKVKRHILLFSILIIPLILLFLLFNIEIWYIPIVEYLIFCSLHVYVIMTKYAFYESNRKSSLAQIFAGIGALGCIFPVLLPVVWLLTVYFYMKSIDKLNYYLDDYN